MLSELLKIIRNKSEITADELSSVTGTDLSTVNLGLGELLKKGRIQSRRIESASCGGCGCKCSSASCSDVVVFFIPPDSRDK